MGSRSIQALLSLWNAKWNVTPVLSRRTFVMWVIARRNPKTNTIVAANPTCATLIGLTIG